MYKIGLKLWSINTDYYYDEAIRLYNEGVFDFIELYVVPDTFDTIKKWEKLNIPFTIHAPHFNHGVNLADYTKFEYNKNIFNQMFKIADKLNVEYIIFHPGVLGDINETIKQLNKIKDDRMIVENKPPYQVPSMRLCRGSSIEEIKKIVNETNLKICLDIGHAICSANYFKEDPYYYLQKFQDLNPVYYHFVDNFIDNTKDKHLNLGHGNYDIHYILNNILNKSNPLLLETNKNSKIDLNDFEEDIKFIKYIKE